MTHIINTSGGGALTNEHGLHFEQATDLADIFKEHPLYYIEEDKIYKRENNNHVATLYQKHNLYKNLLKKNNIKFQDYISRKILPDDAILIHSTNTLYIIEKKFQSRSGSVDEKLATCDFKKKQYRKLLKPLNINVEYCYLLSNWYTQPQYKDIKKYIKSVGCQYFIETIPLEYFSL